MRFSIGDIIKIHNVKYCIIKKLNDSRGGLFLEIKSPSNFTYTINPNNFPEMIMIRQALKPIKNTNKFYKGV